MKVRLLSAAVLALAVGTAVRADDRPIERAEIDKRVVKVVYDAALLGTDLFNKGSHEGCFRLYHGTLLAVHPMLDHRPKLAMSVRDKLEKAKTMKAIDGAFILREALDEIQNEIAPGAKTTAPKALWDRLGGELGVKKVVDQLFALAIEDKAVNLLRDGKVKLDAKGVAHLKLMLVEFVSANTGGPSKYTGKDMKAAHAGMKITEAEFDALGALLVTVLKDNKVAQADIDELVKIVGTTKKDIVEGKGN